MDEDIFKGKWKEISGRIKEKWGKITDDQVTEINGSSEKLAGILQKQYGYQKDQAKQEIKTFLDDNDFNN